MTRVLVLDVGTSALKAVVFDEHGTALAAAETGYRAALAPHRHDADEWWHAARAAIAGLDAYLVNAIVMTGAMENLVAVDAEGVPVADALLYSDPCGAPCLEAARARLEAAGAAAILGNPPEPLMTAFKAAWLAGAEPEAFARARFLLPGAKDALVLRLTGQAATDPVTATTTGLMDLAARAWSPQLAAATGVPVEKLPALLSAGAVVGTVAPALAADLGLKDGGPIPVVNGCGDGGATTLGAFCEAAGDVSLYLGTTGWVARVVESRGQEPDPSVYRLAHPDDGLLVEIAPILSAGAAGNWARAVLGIGEDARDAALAAADARAGDLVFLPYLSGERFPFLDMKVRGAFLGLDAGHRAEDLYYAVLEGVALAIAANLDRLDPGGSSAVRLAGGGATSAVWPQMIADLLGRPVMIPPDPANATAIGAFLVAAKTLGLARPGAGSLRTIAPRPVRAGRAARLRAAFAHGTAAARRLAGGSKA
jgi:xylulokinase